MEVISRDFTFSWKSLRDACPWRKDRQTGKRPRGWRKKRAVTRQMARDMQRALLVGSYAYTCEVDGCDGEPSSLSGICERHEQMEWPIFDRRHLCGQDCRDCTSPWAQYCECQVPGHVEKDAELRQRMKEAGRR
jgi:hypothetical protein